MRQVIEQMHLRDVTIAYGMTETSPVSFQSCIDDPLEARVSTVGSVLPHVEVKIIDPQTGLMLPRGRAGELCTRGYVVMRGYWNDSEATDAAIDAERWMHSGDLAVMREDGRVSIVGRLKHLIIRGGENIYPREIEEFPAHPSQDQRCTRSSEFPIKSTEKRSAPGFACGQVPPQLRRNPGILPRADRDIQDSTLHPLRR
jgi:fatty-acyl-CoA synthase